MTAPARQQGTVVWRPHPGPQTRLLACPVFEVLFGGARGGGKTTSMIGDFGAHAGRFPKHAIGLMLRRERTQLRETIEEAARIYEPLGAKWRDKDSMYEWATGARIHYGYADNDKDVEVYQGWNLTRVYIEELGNFPRWAPIAKLFATLRSAHGVPCRFRATANPGGPGHMHVKARYVDPAPLGYKILREEIPIPLTGEKVSRERVYIPSRVSDNPTLGKEYVANLVLSGAGSPALVRAWLEGDWNAIEGAFFDGWSAAKHVIEPFDIPRHWTRFRAADWGTARPFSIGWYAIASEDTRLITGQMIPRGALIRYREWYGVKTSHDGSVMPNEGIRLQAPEVAQRVVAMSEGEEIEYTVIDPATFANTGGQTIAEAFASHGVPCLRADNTRVAQAGAMSGWANVRQRLAGYNNQPMLYVFSSCTHLIRTLPVMQHDRNRAEDIDTDSEDHAVDELRYACASRPWLGTAPQGDEPMRHVGNETIENLFRLGGR